MIDLRHPRPLTLVAGLAVALGVGSLAILAWVAFASGSLSTAVGSSTRTIDVSMTDDLRYNPDAFTVRAGETIRFAITNPTAIEHEFLLVDEAVQNLHAGTMAAGMTHDGHSISIPAGQTRELIFTFRVPDQLQIGCHVAGHYKAGMRANVNVTP